MRGALMSRSLPVPLVPLAFLFALVSVLPLAAARAQLTRGDSLRVLSEARAAQFRFETGRRMNLPRLQPSAQHQCDALIGRMCYWNEDDDDGDQRDTAVVETTPIRRARGKLITTLDRLATLSPGDMWITGQRVRYLVEGGADSAAVAAGRECRSVTWWCKALTGYALHSAGDYSASEATFDTALAAMPHDVRCKWTDIALLLTDRERDVYQRLPCDARGELEQRFWNLAQPSYAVHGNDRRTEHFSRVLLAELWSSSVTNAYGMPWGDDMREIIVRYGLPLWYATSWPTGVGQAAAVTGHDRPHSYHFAATVGADGTRWDLRSRTAREKYAPPYMDSVADLNAQFAMLKRGDSALLVAIYARPTQSDSAALWLSGDSGLVIVTHDSAHAHVRRAQVPWKEVVAGVEDYDPVRKVDTRIRTWIAPPPRVPGAPEMSTLLLFAGDTSVATGSLEDALAHALTTNELSGARKLGLYWEIYGSNTAEPQPISIDSVTADSVSPATPPADVSISVTRIDGGVFKWLAQALRITPKDSRIAMQWHEARLDSGVTARSVVLDLAALPAGTYRIVLGVGPDDAHRTSTSREIRLR